MKEKYLRFCAIAKLFINYNSQFSNHAGEHDHQVFKEAYGVHVARVQLFWIHMHFSVQLITKTVMPIIEFVIKIFLLNQKNGPRLFELSNSTATLTY